MWIEREDGKEMVVPQNSGDVIYRQAAIDVVHKIICGFFDLVNDDSEEPISDKDKLLLEVNKAICEGIKDLVSAQPEPDREFIKLTVRNSNGRPYYSIIYLEFDDNGVGHDFEGYSSYSLDVISDYLKKYFMPSVTPKEQRWIPVTKRLPKNREWVLGIFQEGDTGWINPIPFICDYVGKKTPITTQDNWLLKLVDEPHPYYENLHCIAWMPLPETWEEGEQG